MPITHPPRPIDGIMVSGMPAPPGTAFTAPGDLGAALANDGYVVDVAVREDATDGEDTLEKLRAMTAARGGPRCAWPPPSLGPDGRRVRAAGPSRTSVVEAARRRRRLHDTAAAERSRAGAARTLAALDNAVGELVSSLPSGTAVVACSDHGFGTLRADLFFDLVLAESGLAPRPSAKGAAIAARRSVAPRPPSPRRPPARRPRRRRVRGRPRHGLDGHPVRVRGPARVRRTGGNAARVTDLLLGVRDPDGKPLVASVTAA